MEQEQKKKKYIKYCVLYPGVIAAELSTCHTKQQQQGSYYSSTNNSSRRGRKKKRKHWHTLKKKVKSKCSDVQFLPVFAALSSSWFMTCQTFLT